ncbi:MAG: fluoride efflux transporter FluC [Kineosporiaceae bacterium]
MDGYPGPRRRAVAEGAVVAAGGALGGLARWSLDEVVPGSGDGVPWATLAANVGGSLLLGALVVVLPAVLPGDRHLRAFLAVGVLGSFTTFAAYTSETRLLLADGRVVTAAVYLLGTAAACLLAATAGMLVARRLLPPEGSR